MVWERGVVIKTNEEIEIMREAGRINALALDTVRKMLRPGVTTGELDSAAEEVIRSYGAEPTFMGYPGPYPYPATLTVCINEELVHGIPGKRELQEGDLVSIDCGTTFKGFIGDSAFSAGVDEIKYNVETMDRELYKEVCPGQDMEDILKTLKEAVEIFGRNKVCSNFIIGLGETDEAVEKGIRELVSLGVVPILRPASKHPLREGEVFIERPSKERLLKLTKLLRRILDENGLREDVFRTMCLPCTGCDMNPHTDLCEDEV